MARRHVECGDELSNHEFKQLFLSGFNIWFTWRAPRRCLHVWLENYALWNQKFILREHQPDAMGNPVFEVVHTDSR